MELTNRPYQDSVITQASEALFTHGHWAIIMTLPTGSGKTVVFSSIAVKLIRNYGRAMILCDRTELIEQAYESILQFGLTATRIEPKFKQNINNIYVASVQTLRNREFPEIDLLIVDEAHMQTFDPIILKYKSLSRISSLSEQQQRRSGPGTKTHFRIFIQR